MVYALRYEGRNCVLLLLYSPGGAHTPPGFELGKAGVPRLHRGAIKATEQPFSQMRRLKCHAIRMAMATLLPCLSKFEVLDLNLDLNAPITNPIGLLSSLAGCSNLRDLEIYYRNSWILSDGITVLNE